MPIGCYKKDLFYHSFPSNILLGLHFAEELEPFQCECCNGRDRNLSTNPQNSVRIPCDLVLHFIHDYGGKH